MVTTPRSMKPASAQKLRIAKISNGDADKKRLATDTRVVPCFAVHPVSPRTAAEGEERRSRADAAEAAVVDRRARSKDIVNRIPH